MQTAPGAAGRHCDGARAARRGGTIAPGSKPSSISPRTRYRKIVLYEPDLAGRAEELAGLAATLGRRFDARAWSMIHAGRSQKARSSSTPWNVDDGLPSSTDEPASFADLVPDLASTSKPMAPPTSLRPRRGRVRRRCRYGRAPVRLRQRRTTQHHVPETMSGGVGLLDYDGDGWLDVYAVRVVRSRPPTSAMRRPPVPQPWRWNVRRCHRAGGARRIRRGGYGHGVAVGDYDNDGRSRPVRHPMAVLRPATATGATERSRT